MKYSAAPARTGQASQALGPATEHVLETVDLSWSVGGFAIVSDVGLRVRRGEFLTVIGPNGAGKSTLMNLLSGVYRPSSGAVHFDGQDITKMGAAHRVRRGLGRTFQTSSLFAGLTVLENARLAAQAALGGSMNLWGRPSAHDRATERAREHLEEVGLHDMGGNIVSDLPYGDKRKLEIALALCGRPRVLLLDEPTAGVSAEDVHSLIDVVRAVHDSGRTVVMVEHRMDLVLDASDRIAVMQDGRLLLCDEPDEVMSDARVQAAYLGPEF